MNTKNDTPHIHRISIGQKKGERKINVSRAVVHSGAGIDGDAHNDSDRPISLLPLESFVKVAHPDLDVEPGDFAENITTMALDFDQLKIGTRVRMGSGVELEIVQIGKECHLGCVIREKVGDCIMPREGVFAKAIRGGEITVGDTIEIVRPR
ncbi:MAG: MOSC domain-containing protein [Candidatus Latescibacterota bacterium]|nr:MAG: MOSC domain-containing protein [Candidatus Latescibacterota bacterium]